METVETATPYALHEGEGEATWFLGNRMTVKATDESTNGGFGLVESWMPEGHSPPLHIHRREDEAFWILEGRLRFRVADEEIVAEAGPFVFGPRDVPHTFVVEDGPAHVLTLLTPGGASDSSSRQAGRPKGRGSRRRGRRTSKGCSASRNSTARRSSGPHWRTTAADEDPAVRYRHR